MVTMPTETEAGSVAMKSRRSFMFPLKIAAAFILLIGIGISVYYYLDVQNKGVMQITSGYGAIKRVSLPDSSVIVLNGNSNIRFSKKWKEDQPREIWLEGEAFFNVKHLNKTKVVSPGEHFIVHVKNINVEVLGTSFDIRQRRDRTVIVLNSGSIKASYNDGKSDLLMVPGDMVTFFTKPETPVAKTRTEPGEFSSWTDKKLIVNNTSVKEIFHYLEDTYGKTIRVEDTSIINRRIEGTIMLDNLDDALFVLSKVLNVKIYNNDSTIIIKSK